MASFNFYSSYYGVHQFCFVHYNLNALIKGSNQECCTFVGTVSNSCYVPLLPVHTTKHLCYFFCSVFALAASLVAMALFLSQCLFIPLTYTKLLTD